MKINDKEYKLKYTGKTLWLYKQEFKTDLIADCKKVKENFDIVIILQVCWAMMKSGDESAPEFQEYLDYVDITSPTLLQEMNDCLDKFGSATKILKKN